MTGRSAFYTGFREALPYGAIMGVVVVVLILLSGCSINLDGNGEFGWKHEVKMGFYHEVEKTDEADKSKAALDVSPAVDLLIKLDKAKSNPDAASDPAP